MAKRYGSIKRDPHKVSHAAYHLKRRARVVPMSAHVWRNRGVGEGYSANVCVSGGFSRASVWRKEIVKHCGFSYYSGNKTPTAAIKGALRDLMRRLK